MSKKIKTEDISYEDALSRLESILENLRSEKVNVDELSKQLQESYKLVRLCQAKIRGVETEIKRVDQDFQEKEKSKGHH